MYISENCNWTPYGTDAELDQLVDSSDFSVRIRIAYQNYGLDKLINDENSKVREVVAKQGYGLDILVNDENYVVRGEVAKHGYGLDKLIYDRDAWVCANANNYLLDHKYKSMFEWAKDNNIDIDIDEWLNSDNWAKRYQVAQQGYQLNVLVNDEDLRVRYEVALQGYGLDKLINDEFYMIREEVANHGYGLNKLVNDESYSVRCAVADQGYGIDVLIKDTNTQVCERAKYYLIKHNYDSIDDWAKDNPNMVHGTVHNELNDELKRFTCEVDESHTLNVESSYESLDEFFTNDSDESYDNNEFITIFTADTKVPLIKLTKNNIDNTHKFMVEIIVEQAVIIRAIVDSKEQFTKLINFAISTLEEIPQFDKYANDLDDCL